MIQSSRSPAIGSFGRWDTLLRAANRRRNEWFLPSDWLPLQIYATREDPVATVCVTKEYVAREIIAGLGRLHDIAVIVCPMLPGSWQCSIIRQQTARGDGVLRFLGDLDPFDIAIYSALRRGDLDMRPHTGSRVRVRHVGVSEAWLAHAAAHLRREYRSAGLTALMQPMSRFEKHALGILLALFPDLPRTLGHTGMQVLSSNHKIEVDALLNPGFLPGRKNARRELLEDLILG